MSRTRKVARTLEAMGQSVKEIIEPADFLDGEVILEDGRTVQVGKDYFVIWTPAGLDLRHMAYAKTIEDVLMYF